MSEMTIEQVLDALRNSPNYANLWSRRLADAIDAHLASQPAEQPSDAAGSGLSEFGLELLALRKAAIASGMQLRPIEEINDDQPKPEQAVGDGVSDTMVDDALTAFDIDVHAQESKGFRANRAEAMREALAAALKHLRPAVATPAEVTDERASFESWMKEHFKYPVLQIDPLHPEHYAKRETAFAWQAWQKRAALTAQCQVHKDK